MSLFEMLSDGLVPRAEETLDLDWEELLGDEAPTREYTAEELLAIGAAMARAQ